MNEEFDPTLEIEISGEGLSEEETAAAVENMQAAEQERAAVQQQYVEQEEQDDISRYLFSDGNQTSKS